MLSPLAKALPAMTALQATVALGAFALSVLAPQLGLSVTQLATLNTLMFGIGTLTTLFAGRLLARWGDWNVATACAAAVALGMACLLIDFAFAPWVAVLLFGLAFGPETPASASVLTRVTPAARRPWIFSIRQTGNQIGAMLGSILLPLLLTVAPHGPYLFVASVAVVVAAWCVCLSRQDRSTPGASTAVAGARADLWRVLCTPGLRALALATLAYTAVQMCLNTFLMSLAVREWQFSVAQAAAWVAALQAAGLGGRLFWGWFAQRRASAARLLGGIGLAVAGAGMALMAAAAWNPGSGLSLMLPVLLLGFCASGWNGVLVAEVSRIAGPRNAGALTGAVLMFGYAGLTLAPLAFAAFSGAHSMVLAFSLLFGAAGAAGGWLMRVPAEPTAD